MTAEPRFSMSVRTALLATCLGLALASPGTAQTCDVPAEYSTIQSAIDDQACSVVDVAAGFYTEALAFTRSVTVLGAAGGTTVLRDAPLVATGSDVDVLLDSLRLENGCQPESLLSSGGATIDAVDVTVAYSSSFGCDRGSLVFQDGFESGNTSRWSGNGSGSVRPEPQNRRFDGAHTP